MVTVPLPDAQLMTFAEFIDWKPDNRRYELHHGTPIEMQPTGDHEEIISFLNSVLVLEVHRLQQPFMLPKQALVKLPGEDTAYLPDVLLLNRDALPHEPLWKKASTVTLGASVPLVVEVVSTNWRDDYGKKLVDYENLGIAEYWIVDYLGLGGRRYIGNPKRPTLSIYRLVEDEYQVSQFCGNEPIRSELFPDLSLSAETIFRAGQ
ncbi:Uma2 family endonuclease [Nodosilinea sp. FACHB-131]|uniref:Uma2 family endonuclease n=1 Tax=Cyanophyceae TaxID=3028117 RepID=UPI0016855C3E|nr:Uma2 family endonuclease [Nodosilinea sp. FACHB-131]MBD1874282.1 Uma2 family endonuclease [Nodosilinea sp. FACHB-131]